MFVRVLECTRCQYRIDCTLLVSVAAAAAAFCLRTLCRSSQMSVCLSVRLLFVSFFVLLVKSSSFQDKFHEFDSNDRAKTPLPCLLSMCQRARGFLIRIFLSLRVFVMQFGFP